MAVVNADKAVSNIETFILDNKKNIDKIIFTVDWHPRNHCSFETKGGEWPVHCTQYSKGASIDDGLLTLVQTLNIPYDVATKGEDPFTEEYGAFVIPPVVGCLFDKHHAIQIDDNSNVVVCGIAGDYCVKQTILNILEFNPKIFLEGVASIDDGTTVKDFIKGFKLDVVELK